MFIIVEYQLFITSKHHQNHAEKSWILNTIPNGVTHYSDTQIEVMLILIIDEIVQRTNFRSFLRAREYRVVCYNDFVYGAYCVHHL